MSRLQQVRLWLLYLSVFTLPMFIRLNNVLLGAFLLLGLPVVLARGRNPDYWKGLLNAWPVLIFFFLAVLACVRSLGWEAFALLERYWSFLLAPLVIWAQPNLYSAKRRPIFLALTYGCIAALLICYGHVFWRMIEYGHSLRQLYEAEYVGSGFAGITESHPAYLGLFILTAIVFLINEKILSRRDIFFHVIFLILGLFQLAGRMAILLFLILLVFLLLGYIRQYGWQIIVLVSGVVILTLVFMNYGSNYMAQRLFAPQSYTSEYRLNRWEVSYDIFKENPVIGVGYKQVREMRKELYQERGLPFGWHGDYNAHNQFLEYLSTNGVIGGFLYVVALMYLLLLSLYRRDLIFIFVFSAFLIANMTESMMVRIQGIEYFAIFATLFLIGTPPKERAVMKKVN